MKKTFILAFASLLLFSCSHGVHVTKKSALDFLYSYMPLPDRLTYDEEYWEANVDKTLEVRERMNWNVPDREFLHYVLPIRVNNETLDDFRTIYADELCERVTGLSMYDAVLEINHWCHEMVTYQPSDARTSSPLATIRKGLGRCGEESVLGVSALRAAGIPARQVYAPRWAHADDNHAWIEAYVDGKWYFLGACEPEPELNMAWFNGPASRSLFIHSKVFGDYVGQEDVITKTATYTEINITSNYGQVRNSVVKVVDTLGNPVGNASVVYKMYNYAEFYSVATYETGLDGTVSLHTGIGDMLVWVSKDDLFGIAKISSDSTVVVLNHRFGDSFGMDIDIVPPAENPFVVEVTDDQIELNKKRLEEEDSIRVHLPKGNQSVIDAFLSENSGDERAEAILLSLTEKDKNDVTKTVLDDALLHCGDNFKTYRDCPRIENEFLYPYFAEIGEDLSFVDPIEIFDWVKNKIKIDDSSNPQKLRISPIVVWRSRCSDSFSRNIFFVAMCRAKGFEARIDTVTLKTQYLQNDVWIDVDFDNINTEAAPQGYLKPNLVSSMKRQNILYYTNFSLSKIENGRVNLLNFDDNVFPPYSELFNDSLTLDEGYYILTTGRRLDDCSVLAHIEFFTVRRGETSNVQFIIREE